MSVSPRNKPTSNGASDRWLTPPEVGDQLGVDPAIRRGELVGVNLADRTSSKPRFRIAPEALAEFLRRREVVPTTPSVRRKKLPLNVKEYF
jgi:hypothetical protein